ncbi:hypothetical protein PIB30_068377 [Stylosanthes scabra]|uniref:Uncharacterized protein n=1 Tax=Stylosanthes scabra TaxID=79078 RepID=A0ABU6QNV6_9FABA|nr:hypothetical protein [Stylosanthes scabra]
MRPILPEICWKEVEDWEIEWIEMRARLLLQSDPETTKPQPEQGIAVVEIQGKKEVEEDADSDSTSNLAKNSTTDQQFNFTRSFHKSTSADNEIDVEDVKIEENLDLQLEQSDLEVNFAATENAIIEVDAVAKEEGEDTANEDSVS